MKDVLISTLLILLSNAIFAQDLIVTNDGDSINCKITRVKSGNIYFTFKYKEEIRNTLLPITKVKEHQFNFYKTIEVPSGNVANSQNYQRFRIAINGGYSYQTAKVAESVPSDFKDYIRKLKSGYHLGADITYYFTESLGFGLKYNLFKTSNSTDVVFPDYMSGKLSDDVTITYIGPTFSTRISNHDNRNTFIIGLSFGYLRYSNNQVIIDNYKMTGSTLGLAFDLGYDIGLSKNVALGFQLSSLTGSLSKYNLNNGTTTETVNLEKGNYEGLNRLDFSIGLRFTK